jgi:hypothetical protein
MAINIGNTDSSKTFTYLPVTADFNSLSVKSNNDTIATASLVKDSD